MNFSNEAILIKKIDGGLDNRGNPTTKEEKTPIYCNRVSIGQQEHYQAQATDLKPSLKIEVNPYEYNEEEALIFENRKYRVIRTFLNKKGKLEIVGEAHTRDNGTK